MTVRDRLRETVLWVGAALGVLAIVWTIVMFAFGLTPLVFTSGSMSPAIDAGDLAFARTVDADEIEVGDIVSVVNEKGVRITHRVVKVDPTDDGAVLVLKGDANAEPDVEPYDVTTVERVLFDVPKAGYVVDAVSSPVGMFVGGLLAAAVLFVAFGGRGGGDGGGESPASSAGAPAPKDDPEPDAVAKRVGRTLRVGPATFALGVTATVVAVQPAQAAFTDTVTVTSGGFTSLALATVPSIGCSGSGGTSVTLSWPDLGSLYEYVVVARDSDNNAYSTQTVRGNGTTVSAVIGRRTPITYTTYEHRVTVTPRLISSTSWASTPTVRSIWERYNLVPGLSNRVFCSAP